MPYYPPAVTPQPSIKAPYSHYFRRIGTGGGAGVAGVAEDRWYPVSLGGPNASLGSTVMSASANRRYTLPLYSPRAATIAEFYMYQGTGIAGNCKLAVYSNSSPDTKLYPDALLWESSVTALLAAPGALTFAANYALSADALYWVDFVSSVAVSVTAATTASMWPIYGYPQATTGSTVAPSYGLWGSGSGGSVYSATSPNPYPTTSVLFGSNMPLIMARYSA